MQQRLRELEEQHRELSRHREMHAERESEAQLLKADQFLRRCLLYRWFGRLRLRIAVSKRANQFAQFKRLRSLRYLKLLTFLYLKQECVMSKHIRQLRDNRLKVLVEQCFKQLQRNAYVKKQARLCLERGQ